MNMPNRLNLKISSKSKFSLLKSSKLKKQARARLCLLLSQSQVIFNINSADENIEYKCLGKLFYDRFSYRSITLFLFKQLLQPQMDGHMLFKYHCGLINVVFNSNLNKGSSTDVL